MAARRSDGLGAHDTPPHVVRFVVRHTVGPLLEGRLPDDREPLRILDPSCGSGVFLAGVYRHLVRWYRRRWLEQRGAATRRSRIERGPRGGWRLTEAERARIIRAHIFGIDVDPTAVARARKRLVRLAGLSDPTALDDNIVCGNAVVGKDWESRTGAEARARDRHPTCPFDWQTAFPDAIANGGFEVVLGNPPYLDSELMTRTLPSWRQYCTGRYHAASGNWDLFCVFVEKAIELCREGGRHGFVVPNKLASAGYAAGAREVLSRQAQLLRVRDYSQVPLFDAHVYPLLYVAKRATADTRAQVRWERMEPSSRGARVTSTRKWPLRRVTPEPRHPWVLPPGPEHMALVERLAAELPVLSSLAEVRGAATVAEAYELPELLSERRLPKRTDLRVVNSGTIDRYGHLWGQKPMRYLRASWRHPVVDEDAQRSLPEARRRQARSPKLVVAGLTRRPECCADLEGRLLAAKSTSVVLSDVDLRYLLAVLNSRLVAYWLQTCHGGESLQGGYLRVGPPQLSTVPVALPPGGAAATAEDPLIELVDRMHVLRAQHVGRATPEQRARVEERMAATDAAIDARIAELYGLNDAERTLVQTGVGYAGS